MLKCPHCEAPAEELTLIAPVDTYFTLGRYGEIKAVSHPLELDDMLENIRDDLNVKNIMEIRCNKCNALYPCYFNAYGNISIDN